MSILKRLGYRVVKVVIVIHSYEKTYLRFFGQKCSYSFFGVSHVFSLPSILRDFTLRRSPHGHSKSKDTLRVCIFRRRFVGYFIVHTFTFSKREFMQRLGFFLQCIIQKTPGLYFTWTFYAKLLLCFILYFRSFYL
jgi:ribosomal protein S10